MTPSLPEGLLKEAKMWPDLSRSARASLGRELRRRGLTFGEIRQLIPVPKATLSYWCRDLVLTDEQLAAMARRVGRGAHVPRDTQWKRRLEVERLRKDAAAAVESLIGEPLWIAGTMLYWAEGSKTKRELSMANTDSETLRIFIAWIRAYHEPDPAFSLMLHLHEGNEEFLAREYWQGELGLTVVTWHKSFVKARGTGHRKNRIPWGVCRVRMRRSADAFVRTEAWIEALRGSPHLMAAD